MSGHTPDGYLALHFLLVDDRTGERGQLLHAPACPGIGDLVILRPTQTPEGTNPYAQSEARRVLDVHWQIVTNRDEDPETRKPRLEVVNVILGTPEPSVDLGG